MDAVRPTIKERFKNFIMNNLLTILLIGGVTLGVICGIIIRAIMKTSLSERHSMYLAFPGELLINMLRCSAAPLIVTCIIVATGSLDLSISKNIGWQLFLVVFVTKIISSTIGVIIAVLIHPGKSDVDLEEEYSEEKASTVYDIFLDMFRNILPANMIRMYTQSLETTLHPPRLKMETTDYSSWDISIVYMNYMNLLGMVFIATVVGITLSILHTEAKGLLVIASEVYLVSMKLVTWILWCAPPFLFFLIMAEILRIKNYGTFFATWGMFIVSVHVAFLIIFFGMHPLMIAFLAGANPVHFFWKTGKALVTAYATASSMGTMPVLIDCLLQQGLDSRLVQFVVPIGTNVNKDGAACFLGVATVFIAQMLGESLSPGQYVIIIFLATMGSVAAAAVPFSSIVVMVMILNGLGLGQYYTAGILTVDWINDRGSTFCNVAGNAVLCRVIAKWNKKRLEDFSAIETERKP